MPAAFRARVEKKISLRAAAFRDVDKDCSGAIDRNELRTAMRTLGLRCEEADVDKAFRIVDRDGDGYIQLEEWLDFMPEEVQEQLQSIAQRALARQPEATPPAKTAKHMATEGDVEWGQYVQTVLDTRGGPEAKMTNAFLAMAFLAFDLDSNFVLDRTEMLAALKGLRVRRTKRDLEVARLFELIDSNQDGVIQLEEWLEHMPKDFLQQLEDHGEAPTWRAKAWRKYTHRTT